MIDLLEEDLLRPERLRSVLSSVLLGREEKARAVDNRIAELATQVSDAEARLSRLYEAIESGLAEMDDPTLRGRLAELKSVRDAANRESDRLRACIRGKNEITTAMVDSFGREASRKLRKKDGPFRRHFVQAVTQKVVVSKNEIRVIGAGGPLLRTLAQTRQASSGVFASGVEVIDFDPKWLPGPDSNRRPSD